jgi:hypothetical protein
MPNNPRQRFIASNEKIGKLYARRAEHICTDVWETNEVVAQLQLIPRGAPFAHCRVFLGAQHLASVFLGSV